MEQTFGEFLREKRLAEGLAIRVFSQLTDLSPTYISYIETGKRPAPSDRKLVKMGDVLSLDEAEREYFYLLAAATREKISEFKLSFVFYMLNNPACFDVVKYGKNHSFDVIAWQEVLRLMEEQVV